jgi:hypothetical protein
MPSTFVLRAFHASTSEILCIASVAGWAGAYQGAHIPHAAASAHLIMRKHVVIEALFYVLIDASKPNGKIANFFHPAWRRAMLFYGLASKRRLG